MQTRVPDTRLITKLSRTDWVRAMYERATAALRNLSKTFCFCTERDCYMPTASAGVTHYHLCKVQYNGIILVLQITL